MTGARPAGHESASPARSQADAVIAGIKGMITAGRLGPGARLPIERDLALELGVSRGSLREGVRALAILGVVETRQGDGTYVTSLDPATLLSPLGTFAELHNPANAGHLLALRRVLEMESAALAAGGLDEDGLAELDRILDEVDGILLDDPDMDLERFIDADTSFHRRIARASGNPALESLIESLVSRTHRARLWRAISDRGTVRETQAEHRAIVAELRRRDPDRARIRMGVHILGVEEFASTHRLDDRDRSAGSSSGD